MSSSQDVQLAAAGGGLELEGGGPRERQEAQQVLPREVGVGA